MPESFNNRLFLRNAIAWFNDFLSSCYPQIVILEENT